MFNLESQSLVSLHTFSRKGGKGKGKKGGVQKSNKGNKKGGNKGNKKGGRKGKGKKGKKDKTLTEDELDKQLMGYMGDEAVKASLDDDLDAYMAADN